MTKESCLRRLDFFLPCSKNLHAFMVGNGIRRISYFLMFLCDDIVHYGIRILFQRVKTNYEVLHPVCRFLEKVWAMGFSIVKFFFHMVAFELDLDRKKLKHILAGARYEFCFSVRRHR